MISGIDTEVLTPKLWTPKEYDALLKSGCLDEELRFELLEGVIVEMTPPGPAHVGLTAFLTSVLSIAGKGEAVVSVQSPLVCGKSRPQPDLALLPLSEVRLDRLPSKALLVVEIADSSVKRDRFKAGLYAKAGIPEYWLVDVSNRTVEVHVEPAPRMARYRTIHILGKDDVLTTPSLPELKLKVATLFAEQH